LIFILFLPKQNGKLSWELETGTGTFWSWWLLELFSLHVKSGLRHNIDLCCLLPTATTQYLFIEEHNYILFFLPLRIQILVQQSFGFYSLFFYFHFLQWLVGVGGSLSTKFGLCAIKKLI